MLKLTTSSPRVLAILIAMFNSILAGIIVSVSLYAEIAEREAYLLLTVLVIFVSMFVPTYYMLNSYIISKLKPVFTTINTIKLPQEDLFLHIENEDIIDEVKNEVIRWAKDKTRQIQELQEAEKYRKEFLGNVSHELKTPIFNIQGYVLTLLDGGLKDKTINKKYLKRTEKNINRLISIVGDLETIANLETGQLKLIYERFDIIELIKEVFELEEKHSKDAGVRLTIDNQIGSSVMVYADRKRVFDIVTNLVINSVKYSKPDGYTIVHIKEISKDIEISVEDNGIGIPEVHLPRIFERFYRVDKSRSREMGGTGLGLAIVKHSIEAHKKKITVQSQAGIGTTFTFSLMKSPLIQ